MPPSVKHHLLLKDETCPRSSRVRTFPIRTKTPVRYNIKYLSSFILQRIVFGTKNEVSVNGASFMRNVELALRACKPETQ